MNYALISLLVAGILFFVFWVLPKFDEDYQAQRLLDKYLYGSLSPLEIGTFYERYIGHLYELDGYHVEYHGALNGVSDLGRDLIVKGRNQIFIIQTKCWLIIKLSMRIIFFRFMVQRNIIN